MLTKRHNTPYCIMPVHGTGVIFSFLFFSHNITQYGVKLKILPNVNVVIIPHTIKVIIYYLLMMFVDVGI